MSWIVPIASIFAILLLLYVAATDIAARLIPNEACLALAVLGIVAQLPDPAQIIQSLIVAAILFALLFAIYTRGVIGGGDVKLLTALAIGLPLTGVMDLLAVTALSGGVLALVHLLMRQLPQPALAPAGSSLVRRVYAVERWRHLRYAPLPYGVAIACGGISATLSRGF
jgi:prepilin peptidase CpaA